MEGHADMVYDETYRRRQSDTASLDYNAIQVNGYPCVCMCVLGIFGPAVPRRNNTRTDKHTHTHIIRYPFAHLYHVLQNILLYFSFPFLSSPPAAFVRRRVTTAIPARRTHAVYLIQYFFFLPPSRDTDVSPQFARCRRRQN